jgi:CBS domain-containing protein
MPFNLGTVASRIAIVVEPETPVLTAARLMREHHVGALIVTTGDGARRPVGMVTDRDLVVEVLAQDVDQGALRVGDVMSSDIVTARETDAVFEATRTMRERGVRRLVVVGEAGELVGIVTMDDLVALLAEELGDLAQLVRREIRGESRRRPPAR